MLTLTDWLPNVLHRPTTSWLLRMFVSVRISEYPKQVTQKNHDWPAPNKFTHIPRLSVRQAVKPHVRVLGQTDEVMIHEYETNSWDVLISRVTL